MKAISLLNLFTLVGVLLVGTGASAACTTTKEACIAAVARNARISCDATYRTSTSATKEQDKASCYQTTSANAADDPSCGECQLAADINQAKNDCKALLSTYDESIKKAIEQCGYVSDVGSLSECQSKASACARGQSPDGLAQSGGSDSLATLMTQVITMNANQSSTTPDGCSIANDDTQANSETSLKDKIASIREKINSDKNKKIEEDDKINKKRDEVQQKIQDAKEEVDKKKFERQSAAAKDAYDLTKANIDLEKKRRKTATDISDKTTQISNLAFASQELNLKFADTKIAKTCRDRFDAIKAAKMAVDPKTGKKKTKLSASEAAQLKKDLLDDQASCLSEEGLKKQAQFKGLQDTRKKLQADIDTLNGELKSDQDAYNANVTNINNKKAQADAEEKNDITNLQTKMTQLNQTVTDLETTVAAKKKNIDEQIAAREAQITDIGNTIADVKPKFNKVANAVNAGSTSANNFVGQCCSDSDKTKNAAGCSRVKNDYPDSGGKSSGSFSGTNTGI
jgi:hypothetical protein